VFSGVRAVEAQEAYDTKRKQLGITPQELDAERNRVQRWSVASDILSLSAVALGGYCVYLMAREQRDDAPVAERRGVLLEATLSVSGAALRGSF
jgi:hypothetical protein